jgi:hypothetical protein
MLRIAKHSDQIKALVEELRKPLISAVPGIPASYENNNLEPVVIVKGGNAQQGTFVVKALVYAYGMWISPAFHLAVIRSFDALQTRRGSYLPLSADPLDSPDVRHAIERKAHALSVHAFESHRDYLENWVRTHPDIKDRASVIEQIEALEINDRTHVMVDYDLLFAVTGNARACHRMQAFAIERLGRSIGRNLYD